MISIDECKYICSSRLLTDMQMLAVIERYIYDKKGVIVEINRPTDIINIKLMNIAFDSASEYYLNLK